MAWTRGPIAAALLCAVTFAGCGGDEESPPPPPDYLTKLQGTWIACYSEGTGDTQDVLVVDGSAMSGTVSSFPSADATCSGTPTATHSFTASGVIGGERSATLGVGGPTVIARDVDVAMSGAGVFYSILFVDESSEPHVLYTGDQSIDPALDGSAPEKRPVVLEAWKPRFRGEPPPPTPPSFAELLPGTWASCQTTGYGDLREALTFSTATWSGIDSLHPSHDGTCSGSVLDSMTMGGWFTLGPTVSAPLGSTAVPARAADLHFTYPASVTLYTLLYVDDVPATDVLYIGDTSGTYNGTTASLRPITLVPQLPYYRQ